MSSTGNQIITTIQNQANPENEKLSSEAQLRERMDESDIFHSPEDHVIAEGIWARLKERLDKGQIDEETYYRAIEAMNDLVPHRNEKGHRQIADITITPLMEKTIRSRIASKELDITVPEGSWGSLPDVVKERIAQGNSLLIEMTTNCTVRCPFCSFSSKGAIQEKMSFHSVLGVLRYFTGKQPSAPFLAKPDTFYWGTDPFDAKWETDEGELDYNDLADEYWRITRGKPRFLYTSTAIPLGEELRVLKFADNLITKRRKSEIAPSNQLRISKTDTNKERVEDIVRILKALHGGHISEALIEISRNRSNEPALRGEKNWQAWQRKKDPLLSTWNIIGPNCKDDVIIGVRSVDGVIMQAASIERPDGELRFPIRQDTKGGKVYHIPIYQAKPDFDKVDPEEIYPNAIITKITINGKEAHVHDFEVPDDPHRAFLRMVGHLVALVTQHNGTYRDVHSIEKVVFRNARLSDFQIVQAHLANTENPAMEHFLRFVQREGFIY